MNKAKVLCMLLVLVLSPAIWSGQITPYLADYLQGMTTDNEVEVVVMFENQADIETLNRQLKIERATLAERNKRVVEALQQVAGETQPAMSAYLDNLQAQNMINDYRLLWISNMAIVKSSPAGVYEMATQSSIADIYYSYPIEGDKPLDVNSEPSLIANHEQGLDRINAPLAWSAGFTGEGRVVANMDTGVDGYHPALAERFRGDVNEDGLVDESWYDPYAGWTYPQDSGSHGTHTLGTICGRTESGSDTIGVAIDAQWIAAAPIDRGGGISGTIADAILSFQWFADPDGDPSNQDNPDVVGNSWGIPDGAGYPDCDESFWVVIDNLEAAGTVVVFSAGNEGSSGLRSPADRATTRYNCFSVGAVDGANDNLPPAYFTALGPTECASGDLAIKPEITAPGVNVRSSVPGGGYSTMSGTSMSSPHVSGAVALVRQANPNLDVDAIKDILMSTAIDLPFSNPDGEDNTYGHGIMDVYQACLWAQGFGYAAGVVYNEDEQTIEGARVQVDGSPQFALTDSEGAYLFGLLADTTYSLTASYFGHISESAEVTIETDETTVQDFYLDFAENGVVHGYVTDLDEIAIEGAMVSAQGMPLDPVYTNGDGYYIMDNIPGGAEYTIGAAAPGYGYDYEVVTVPVDDTVEVNLMLQELESFEFNNAGWEGDDIWEWGEPYSGPGGAYDGIKVWGTVLGGEYPNSADASLITTYYEITDEDASFTFYHWYNIENSWDGGNVSISTDGGTTWTIIYPDAGYPDDSIVGLDGEPGFTDESGDWQQAVFTIPGYVGEMVKFKLRFGSDSSIMRDGWYIDGVVVNGAINWGALDPEIVVEPTSLSATLDLGDSEVQNLTISNVGEGILSFEAAALTDDGLLSINPGNGYPVSEDDQYIEKEERDGLVYYNYVGPKSANTPSNGGGVITDFGGPDEYGYRWTDSNEPDGPHYDWIDITGIGTPITGHADDSNVGPFDIGFEFPFYGNIFTTFNSCSNGWISFTATNTDFSNDPIPYDLEPNNLLAIFWDDLNFNDGGEAYFYTNYEDTLIVSYISVAHFSVGGPYTFQAILTADGDIVYQYAEINDPFDSHTIGIEDEFGMIGLQVINEAPYIANEMAVKINHPVFWLTVSPSGGTVAPDASTDLSVTFDASEVGEGQYTGEIRITSNDLDNPVVSIPCTLTVDPTGIEDETAIPTAFALNQNYPNPFNPSTDISFGLPASGQVTLEVYDIMGRMVATLVDGHLAAGIHNITWEGVNSNGEQVSTGMYFYKLTQGDNVTTKKMMMLK
ncbi:MAG: S8 family serine peptidase [candidate division Zixibacteria bacterium]|nr:S8 family serine peptidase [candidate division Zixibacteria bacterium]